MDQVAEIRGLRRSGRGMRDDKQLTFGDGAEYRRRTKARRGFCPRRSTTESDWPCRKMRETREDQQARKLFSPTASSRSALSSAGYAPPLPQRCRPSRAVVAPVDAHTAMRFSGDQMQLNVCNSRIETRDHGSPSPEYG